MLSSRTVLIIFMLMNAAAISYFAWIMSEQLAKTDFGLLIYISVTGFYLPSPSWEEPDFESCSVESQGYFIFNLTNYAALQAGTEEPSFTEVGPYNASRTVCSFDYSANLTGLWERHLKWSSDWNISSDTVNVDEPVTVVNLPYFFGMGLVGFFNGAAPGQSAEAAFEASVVQPRMTAEMAFVETRFRDLSTELLDNSNATIINALSASEIAYFVNNTNTFTSLYRSSNFSAITSEFGFSTQEMQAAENFLAQFTSVYARAFVVSLFGGNEAGFEASGPVKTGLPYDMLFNNVDGLLQFTGFVGPIGAFSLDGRAGDSILSSRDEAVSQDLHYYDPIYFRFNKKGTLSDYKSTVLRRQKEYVRNNANGPPFWRTQSDLWSPPEEITGITVVGACDPGLKYDNFPDQMMWFGDGIDRNVKFSYESTVDLGGFNFGKYITTDDFWAANSRYQQSIPGLLNVSAPGFAPFHLYLSLPGFVHVPSEHTQEITNKREGEELTFLIHETLGVPLVVNIGFQFNLHSPGFGYFDQFVLEDGYYPLFWKQTYLDFSFVVVSPEGPLFGLADFSRSGFKTRIVVTLLVPILTSAIAMIFLGVAYFR